MKTTCATLNQELKACSQNKEWRGQEPEVRDIGEKFDKAGFLLRFSDVKFASTRSATDGRVVTAKDGTQTLVGIRREGEIFGVEDEEDNDDWDFGDSGVREVVELSDDSD